MSSPNILALLDTDNQLDIQYDQLILWRAFARLSSDSVYSLPELVELHSVRYKNLYLQWLNDLGLAKINNSTLLDYLCIRPGFSYWWMTLLAEKSVFKSLRIYDIVKLFAFEDLCTTLKPSKIIVATQDHTLALVVKDWCKRHSIAYERYHLSVSSAIDIAIPLSFVQFTQIFFSFARIFKYYVQRLPLANNSDVVPFPNPDLIVIDNLAHLTGDSVENRTFESNYWGPLVSLLRDSKLRVNWLHHYLASPKVSSSTIASLVMKSFNNAFHLVEFHAFIDIKLSIPLLSNICKDYLRLVRLSFSLLGIRHHFIPRNSKLNLWPLLSHDWITSTVGSTAVFNCFILNLFEAYFSSTGFHKVGIYLQENQGWEAALIYAWKAFGNGKLIGVAHSTVRFWDLRYFHHPDIFKSSGLLSMPRPNAVALNSKFAKDLYVDWGYPRSELLDVEALRYFYLNSISPIKTLPKLSRVSEDLRILILGDILPIVVSRVFTLIHNTLSMLDFEVTIYFRAHPACYLDANKLPNNFIDCSSFSLPDCLALCDVVISGNSSSSSVDAYLCGVPVIQFLSPDQFNLCSLHGLPEVIYVRNAGETKAALASISASSGFIPVKYFNVNSDLAGWKKILS